MAIATHSFSDSLDFGFGAIANYIFGVFLPLPVLQLDWTPDHLFKLQLFFPQFARAVFLLGDRIAVGLAGYLEGNRYTVNEDEIPLVESIKYTVAHGGAIAGVRLFSQLWLSGYVGYTFYRQYELLDDDDGQLFDPELENALVGRISLEFRPAPFTP